MSEPTAPGDPLDQIIADYLQAAEAGRVPSRQALLDAHPEFADDLRAFFADYDRLDNRADALKLAAARPPADRPKVRYFGDYELLEEIAEGGMGLVYKARQESLGRVVALKLVRAGRLAKPTDIARFRIEAEAAAGLDHPNIVPLYEVGEHDGQQYLAMKFIDGPSLAKLPRGDVRAEVALMEKVARAVHHAHQQGIIHRDIKPSNILTDAAGTPYVTDFGLAKRLDAELSLTESGQMLGTAGYVAPEQALGKKGLTVTADVFSLGAVLFERLTGTPAFPGGTVLERLRSLHDSATPRPTVLMPALPRDLETVVLKCLEREPAKRYATAGVLADDLARWLRGEPIVARRVTAAERFWLWCRRNPAVAGLAAAMALALVGGTAVSWTFAAQARREAVAAAIARQDAEDQSAAARAARRDFVFSLLQTVGARTTTREQAPAERWAFFELARLGDEVRADFLAQALSDPDLAERFASSGELAVQAAIGGSDRRRRAASRLAAEKLRDAAADERVRYAAGVLALRLGADDVPLPDWTGDRWLAAGQECGWVVPAGSLGRAQLVGLVPAWLRLVERSDNSAAVEWAAEGLAAACPVAPDGGALATRVAATLTARLETTTDRYVVHPAAAGLAALAPRLDEAEAARAFDAMLAGFDRTANDLQYWRELPELAAVARRLDGPAAVRASDHVLGVLARARHRDTMQAAGPALAVLAPRLDGAAAGRAWDGLVGVLAQDGRDLPLAEAFEALAGRLDGPAAERAWDGLVGVLRRGNRSFYTLQGAGQGLTVVAARLDAAAVPRAADRLVELLRTERNADVLSALAQGLTALGQRLDGPAAIRAGDGLTAALDKPAVHSNVVKAAEGLAAVADRLDGPAAQRAWDGLSGVAEKTADTGVLAAVGRALAALAPRVSPAAVRRVADGLIAGPGCWRVVVVAPLLDSPTAIRASDALAAAAGGTTDGGLVMTASQAWAALAPRLDGPTAKRAWDCLVDAVGRAASASTYEDAVRALAALAARLDPPAAATAFDTVVRITEGGHALGLSDGLGAAAVALLDRMDAAARPGCRARLARAAVAGLKQVRNRDRLQGSWSDVCFVIDQFAPVVERSITAGDLRLGGIGRGDEGDAFNEPRFAVGWPLFAATADLATIADCLRHPACVGDTRQKVLHRLEEIAFPPPDADRQQAAAGAAVTGLAQPLAGGLLAAGRQAAWERRRKFRTTWDAVAWLREHHPEIDLDKPYTPRK